MQEVCKWPHSFKENLAWGRASVQQHDCGIDCGYIIIHMQFSGPSKIGLYFAKFDSTSISPKSRPILLKMLLANFLYDQPLPIAGK